MAESNVIRSPFRVDWQEDAVAAVMAAVRCWRAPKAPLGSGWDYGCDADFLFRLRDFWTERFDWRLAQDRLNLWPQYIANIEGKQIHYVHVVGEASGRRPLLISHGWPGSHYESWGLIERLAFPSRWGGDPADAFDLVIPSLPGFGFSFKSDYPVGPGETARLFHKLMQNGLGYQRYLAHGGDWGARISTILGCEYPDSAVSIHITMVGLPPQDGATTPEEQQWLKRTRKVGQGLGAYLALQSSKPQSLIWAMANNPVGQAAWIIERFHDWSDLRYREFEEIFDLDHLLTNVMIYVMEDALPTSIWYYRARIAETQLKGDPHYCPTPASIANFYGEPLYSPPPRSWTERAYNVVRWTEFQRGGHFAALEEPEVLIDDLRAWARKCWHTV